MAEGIIYILTNEAMPGYVKIGKTGEELTYRIKQLDTTSVPLSFTCFYASRVSNYDFIEKKLHEAFADHRVRSNREFFRVSPERVMAALLIAGGKDVTPRKDVVEQPEDEKALNDARKRRSRFSFDIVGLKPGIILHSAFDPDITCMIANNNKITFEGKEASLSAAAKEISERKGYDWAAVAGPDYWLYEGKSLTELRYEMETGEDLV